MYLIPSVWLTQLVKTYPQFQFILTPHITIHDGAVANTSLTLRMESSVSPEADELNRFWHTVLQDAQPQIVMSLEHAIQSVIARRDVEENHGTDGYASREE